MCIRKGTFIIQKMRNRLFVRALHMVIVIIVWCRFISNVVIVAKKCRSQKAERKGGRDGGRERERDWQLIAFQCIYSIFLWYHFWTVKKEFYLYETDCFIYKFLCSFFFISIVPIPNAFKNQASEREREKKVIYFSIFQLLAPSSRNIFLILFILLLSLSPSYSVCDDFYDFPKLTCDPVQSKAQCVYIYLFERQKSDLTFLKPFENWISKLLFFCSLLLKLHCSLARSAQDQICNAM